jgi:phage terminase large subunit-like protein
MPRANSKDERDTRKPSRSTSTSIPLPRVRPSTDKDPVSAYAWDVLNNKIVTCRFVRLACERHFRDIDKGPKRGLVWSPEWAIYASTFYARFLRHSKGEWAGQPLKLAPWQEFIHGSVYGWFNKDGTRRFRTVYEEIARKNGKSSSAAAVGIYGLMADHEPGAEVYASATRRDQARIVFDEAKRMVRASPELAGKVGVFKLNLSIDDTNSKFEPLSADDRTLDGLNPHVVLVDELHRHKSRAVLDVLDTALGSRRNPLIWIITTAGDDNPESVYASENGYAIQVLEGTVRDDSYFAFIATLDKGDAWDDPKNWIKANPNLNVSVKMSDLKRQALKAKHSPAALVAFKRLRLNIRTSDATRAIDMEVWRRNSRGPFDPALLYGRRFFGAIDLSSKVDLSAWVKLFPPVEGDPLWRVVPRFWMPQDTIEIKSQRDQVQYQRWVNDGLIEITGGNVIDHNEITSAVLEDCRLFEPCSVAFDPWNAQQMAVALANEGLPVFEFIQGIRSYTAPTKEMEAMLLAEKFDHGGNEVLAWMANNLHVQIDKNENRMPTKAKSTGRIDGITALIMAIGRSMVEGVDAGGFLEGTSV